MKKINILIFCLFFLLGAQFLVAQPFQTVRIPAGKRHFSSPAIEAKIAGVINRQTKCVLIDPYANAFNRNKEGSYWSSDITDMKPELHERKWEVDGLCYVIRLAYEYMFRPSDDATTYPFLIPSNCFAVVSLRQLAEMERTVFKNTDFASECEQLATEVDAAIRKYGIVNHPKYGKIYAYEVDGFGNYLMMDDANYNERAYLEQQNRNCRMYSYAEIDSWRNRFYARIVP